MKKPRRNAWTTGAVARHCGVHLRTVLRWIERGEIQAFQLPGRGDHRVASADLAVFLRRHGIPLPAGLDGRASSGVRGPAGPTGPGPAGPDAAGSPPTPPADRESTAPRALVVDADAASARGVARTLRRAGYETRIAFDGFSAGGYLVAFAPSVAVVDPFTLGSAGLGALRLVRDVVATCGGLTSLKVLVLSAVPPERLAEAYEQGADAVLSKPCSPAALIEAVGRLVALTVKLGDPSAGVPAGPVS